MTNSWKRALSWSVIVVIMVGVYQCSSKDDTDGPDGRSGFTLMTDAATGCQYLRVWPWDFHPRLDGDGKHMCTPVHLGPPPVDDLL